MSKVKAVTMEGLQALSFASIHPIKCGTVYAKVKQLEQWVRTHDALVLCNPSRDHVTISHTETITCTGDIVPYMRGLLRHITDGDRELVLVIDGQRYVIAREKSTQFYGYRVMYDVNNGRDWIRQDRQGWLFPDNVCGMLDTLLGSMLSDNWSRMESDLIITE